MSQNPLIIEVKVKPNARDSQLRQEESGQWLAQLKSPPVDGKANAELIGLVAKHFGCRKAAVSIKTGSTGRLKLVKIAGPHDQVPLGSTGVCRSSSIELQCNSTTGAIMAANQLVQTRIDGAIKTEAAAVLAAMGLTVSDAVRLMLTKVAKEHALPFDPLIPNATTIAAIKEARASKLPRVKSIADLKSALNARD